MTEIKVEKGCQLAPIVQYICSQDKDHTLKCQPFLRLFEMCPGKPAVEVTPDIPPTNFDYSVLETNEYQLINEDLADGVNRKCSYVKSIIDKQVTTRLIVNARVLNGWKDISASS